MQCPNDKHNFIQADVYTGGTLYRCDKCWLEAHAPMFSGMIFKEYFGSYIGGISHKWLPSDMRAEDIVSFAVSFGDLPIVTVRYDGNMMKITQKFYTELRKDKRDEIKHVFQSLRKAGKTLRLNTNIYKGNLDTVDEMESFVRYFIGCCDTIKFSPLMATDMFA